MTLYLIPCGISLLMNMRHGRGAPARNLRSGEVLDSLKTWADSVQDGTAPPQLLVAWRREWQALAPASSGTQPAVQPLRLNEWEPKVSAELSTLAKRTKSVRAVGEEDTIVLLASQTGAGLLSALLTATHLTGGDLDRIRYDATPPISGLGHSASRYQLSKGLVCVVTVSGLRPRHGDGWRSAAGGIGDVMRAGRDCGGDGVVEVHLSGGFKPTLLHTVALAEYLKSTARKATVSAWSLADTEEGNDEQWADIPPEEIGLRCFHSSTVGLLRRELSSVLQGQKPQTREYEGVAWSIAASGRPELNAFGYGYLSLVGPSSTISDEGQRVT